jgi:PST family polysaccharide transporter
VFAQVVAFGLQLIGTVVLARLLNPGDFGVVTLVTTVSLLLASLGQIGFPEAVLQRERVDRSLASNLFWVNVGAALVLTIALASASPLLARLSRDPRAAQAAIGLSVTILLTSTGVLHLALLKRAMRFSAVSANDIVARTVAVGVSIVLGWAGYGYWALVSGALAQALSTSLGAWILCRWIPDLPHKNGETTSAIRFATQVYGRYAVDYTTRNMDNMLVGSQFGSGALGLYKKAYDIFALLSSQLLSVFPVAVSTLSRLNRDSAEYKRYLYGGLSLLAFVGAGLGADITLVGRDLVRIILGPRWEPAGQMLSYFGPGIGIMLVYGVHGIIHLSLGTPNRWLRWGMIEFTVTGLLFLLALRWGPSGIAAAWTASFWILIVPAFWYAGRPMRLGIKPLLDATWKYIVASLLAGSFVRLIFGEEAILSQMTGTSGALVRVVVTSVVLAVFYLAAVVLLHFSFKPIRQFRDVLWEIALGDSRSTATPEEDHEAVLKPSPRLFSGNNNAGSPTPIVKSKLNEGSDNVF